MRGILHPREVRVAQSLHRGQTMTETVAWTCPSCSGLVATPYCAECGERPLGPRELTLRGLVDQVFQALTSVDGRLLRSFRCLLARPGLLTVSYLRGRRKPYIGPVSLFLVTNVLFFAAESLTGGTVFSTPLQSHLHTQPWSDVAQPLVSHRLASLQTTVDQYAPLFDRAISLHARSLILLMALSFAVLPAIVFRRGRHPFAAHAVFALHLYAFMLLLFCVATAIPAAGMLAGGVRSTSQLLDQTLSIGLLLACAVYLYFAVGAVYGGSRAARVAGALVLTIAAGTLVLGYRFVLLLLTLYST
jgi:hypothetical protein